MVIISNANGDIVKSIPDNVYQGSNNANKIIVLAPFSATAQLTINFKKPNGVLTEERLMTAYSDIPADYSQLNAWFIDLGEDLTELYGTLSFQVKAYTNAYTLAQINAYIVGETQDGSWLSLTEGGEPLTPEFGKVYIIQSAGQYYGQQFVWNGVAYTQTQNRQILTSFGCDIQILRGVAPILPATPNQTIYEQILQAISSIGGDITDIYGILATKQDKADNTLNTADKTVVGAINGLYATSEQHTAQIATNSENIAENANDIDFLYEHMAQAEEYIGQMTGNALPTDIELTDFVVNNTNPSRTPKNGDVVIYILQIVDETDKNYKYIYSVNGWNGYEIPPLENAQNGTLGIVEGTYGIGLTYETLVNISGGQIRNIYVKDLNGTYRDIKEYANALNTTIQNIIDGDTTVGVAIKALEDGVGNNIVSTYLTQNAGATKQYVKNYALPREFNDIYFISSEGYQREIPTTPASGIQFTKQTSAVGDAMIFQIEKQNDADFELSSKNGAHNNIYVSVNRDCEAYFRLTTQAKKVDEEWVDLSVELSNSILITAGEIRKLAFSSLFNDLGSNVISLTTGDKIRQTLEVVMQESTATTFDIYSNTTYPSDYAMNIQTQTITIASGKLGEQPKFVSVGERTEGNIDFPIADEAIFNNNTEAEFVLTFTGAVVPTDTITLSYGDQVIRFATPYNFDSGNATIQDMSQVAKSIVGNITTWTFKGFIQNVNDEITINVDMDDLSNYSTSGARVQPIDMNSIIEGTQIKAYLDNTLSDFQFEHGGFYKFHILLPISLYTQDLPNAYTIDLYDKIIAESESANKIVINNIFNTGLDTSTNVGQMCAVQDYQPATGVVWVFNARYSAVEEGGVVYKGVYTTDITRENTTSMSGADLYSAVANSTLKTGTAVVCTQDYTNGTISYTAGTIYKITGQVVDDSLIIDAEAMHDSSKLDKNTTTTGLPQAYVKNADGSQTMTSLSYGKEGGTIVYRNGAGVSSIADPPSDYAIANKRYVDNTVTSARTKLTILEASDT